MNKNVEFAIKWGLIIGLVIVAAQQIAAARIRPALPAPAQVQPQPPVEANTGGYAGYQPPADSIGGYCQDNPNDPLCTSFGGPGAGWI